MKKLVVSALVIVLSFLLQSCNTTEPQPPPPNGEKPTIELTLEDVSCIEAWIKLTTNNLQLPATITLKQTNPTGDTTFHISILTTQDSLLYIDSLLPNQNYQYQVSSIENTATSNELTVTTMDTTSHNFTFETFTFGGTSGSSVLYDCAIISPENIWAVGEIYVADTSINGYTMYNAVQWDGVEWQLKRIPFTGNCSAVMFPAIRSVWAFSDSDIWFARGGSLVHFDGIEYFNDCRMNSFLTGSINKIWGSNSDDLYVVGNNGNLAYYNGTIWQRIESGTDVNINDVFGIIDNQSSGRKVFCAASFVLQLGEHKILTIDENNRVDSLNWNTGRRVNSTWSNNGWIVYTSGGGVFNNKSGRWKEETSIPLYYTNRIRGNGLNDIFVAGDFGLLAHFNGMEWNIYNQFLFVASSLSISINENIIAAVGRQGEKALIIVGKRN